MGTNHHREGLKKAFVLIYKQRCSQGSPASRGRGFTVAKWLHGLESHDTPTVWDDVGSPHHETKGQLCRDILESLRWEHQFYLSLNSKLCLSHSPASRQMCVYLSVPKLVPEKEKKNGRGQQIKPEQVG